MNTSTRIAGIPLLIVMLTATISSAETLYWNGQNSKWWDVNTNWEDAIGDPPDDPPGDGDTAVIQSSGSNDCYVRTNVTVAVLETQAGTVDLRIGDETHSGHLDISDHMDIGGRVEITQSGTLELSGASASTVDGTIVFWLDVVKTANPACDGDITGLLKVSANATIEGDGGLIYGRECSADEAPTRGEITTTATNRLTLETTNGGTPLSVIGYLDIQALLSNDSAHVGTNESADVLQLSTEDKDGDDGIWFCDDGEFRVKNGVTVTGGNDWDMSNASSGAELFFESGSDCTCLSGDFDIHDGTIWVDADVCTSGSATVKSVSDSQPTIFTYEDDSASFAGVCTGCGS